MKSIEFVTDEEIRSAFSIRLHNQQTFEAVEITRNNPQLTNEKLGSSGKNGVMLSATFNPHLAKVLADFVKRVDLFWRGTQVICPVLRTWLSDWILQYSNLSPDDFRETAVQHVEQVHKHIMFERCPEHNKPITVKVIGIDFGKTGFDYSGCCCDDFLMEIKNATYVEGVDQRN